MGTKDIETAIFFDDDRRYADLLNGYIFDGKQIITEKQLYSQDTRETGKSQKDSWGVQKRKKIQRFRDGVKRVAFGTSFTVIALEHQDKIHRGMPVRVMVEDAYDLIAAMTDTKQLQMVKDKYRSEEGGINMCKGLLDWVEESKSEGRIEGKSAGELSILKLITAMQSDGRTSDITRLSSEPEFLEGMKKHYHIQ